MAARGVATFVVLGATCLALIGCTSPTPTVPDEDIPKTATAQVEVRTITDALALDAIVGASATYSITAKTEGALTVRRNIYYFTPTGGTREKVALPATGVILSALVPLGTKVRQGIPLVSVQDSDFFLNAILTPAQVLRLNGRQPSRVMAQIDGSSGPFQCELADWRPTAVSDKYSLSCRVPEGVDAVAGAKALMVLNLDEHADVLALPIEAVAGSIDAGSVLLLGQGGKSVATDVQLGITDGAWIEITGGLKEGDVVEIPSPSLLAN